MAGASVQRAASKAGANYENSTWDLVDAVQNQRVELDKLDEKDILEVLSFMDVPRQREVYLRMARLAAISGQNKLASLAAERAQILSGDGESVPKVLADLYSGLASVPSGDVASAMETIVAIPDDKLSVKDRALKEAARAVAEEVLRAPVASAQKAEPLVSACHARKTR